MVDGLKSFYCNAYTLYCKLYLQVIKKTNNKTCQYYIGEKIKVLYYSNVFSSGVFHNNQRKIKIVFELNQVKIVT